MIGVGYPYHDRPHVKINMTYDEAREIAAKMNVYIQLEGATSTFVKTLEELIKTNPTEYRDHTAIAGCQCRGPGQGCLREPR